MNNDIILEICIAGLNCRAGYATEYKCRQHVHREILIRVTILYYLYSPETILPSAINALLHQSQFFFQQTSKLQLPKQWRIQHRIKKPQITVTESHMACR